jgi:hypothetical protein
VVAHVTRLSQKPTYVGWVFVPFGLVAALAAAFAGPVATYVGLVASCVAMGSIVAAWMSMLSAAWASRGTGESWHRAFFAADINRWTRQGLAIGSAIGLVLTILALLGV